VTVRLGITDGAHTELLGNELQPGTELVTAVTLAAASQPVAGGQSPLIPQRQGRGR
jgi:hypothetical protein